MKYNFNGKEFTLKKNTYFLEQKAKEASGVSATSSQQIQKIKFEYDSLSKKLEGELTTEQQTDVNEKLSELTMKILSVNDSLSWHEDFEKSKEVFKIILFGDVDSLTNEDFGKWEALKVWQDFFTDPSKRKED